MPRSLIVSVDPGGYNMGVATLDLTTWHVEAYPIDWTQCNGLTNIPWQNYVPYFVPGFLGPMADVLSRASEVVIEMPYVGGPVRTDIGYRLMMIAIMVQHECHRLEIPCHYLPPTKIKHDFGITEPYRGRKKLAVEWALKMLGRFTEDNAENKITHGQVLGLKKKDDPCDALVNMMWYLGGTPVKTPDEAYDVVRAKFYKPTPAASSSTTAPSNVFQSHAAKGGSSLAAASN